jgi:cyanophycinase
MNVKGTLIAIGGNEDKGTGRRALHEKDTPQKFVTSGILFRVAAEMKHPEAPIEVITTASSIPEKVGRDYQRAFRRLGRGNVGVLHLETYADAARPDVLERVAGAGCLLFSGGDQLKLVLALRDTPLAELIHARYVQEPVVIAGTSAGAMALSDLMMYPGSPRADGLAPELDLQPGLALVHDTIIDTHFLVRGRFRRLALAVSEHPQHLGIGLEEDTGVIIRQGNQLETIGSGLVTLIDGRSLHDSNVTVAKSEHEIFIENLLVHVLAHGNNFRLRGRKIS